MSDAVQSVTVSIRSSADRSVVSLPWELATTEVLASAGPWRTFRWHKGQLQYSGAYWSATEGSHVIYESRLEQARLLFADFDTSVKRIIAQPFLLSAQVEATVRRHVPDFLLLSDTGASARWPAATGIQRPAQHLPDRQHPARRPPSSRCPRRVDPGSRRPGRRVIHGRTRHRDPRATCA
jgi:hypothetical protein